jgi:hypothetical protein
MRLQNRILFTRGVEVASVNAEADIPAQRPPPRGSPLVIVAFSETENSTAGISGVANSHRGARTRDQRITKPRIPTAAVVARFSLCDNLFGRFMAPA